jgi:pimeloyl-ACP methyl ester carboxylesterase
VQLHYDAEGDGPLVVLLHGFPESRMTWRRMLPALAAEGFRAIAPDLRGYGDSPKPKGVEPYKSLHVAGDVAELIEANGGSCVLVAHDWGAATAWGLAMTRPDLIRHLVIINVPHPAAILRELGRSTKQKLRLSYQLFFQLPLLPELFMRFFGKSLMRRAGRIPEELIAAYAEQWRTNLTPMLNYYRALPRSRGEIRNAMSRIELPVTILWGKYEPVFLRSTVENLEKWIANVRVVEVKAGHFAHHDAFDAVRDEIVTIARA